MNTRDIQAFLAVVDAGSIMGAAARLHLTQPAITRRVQGLEEALGAQLLDRVSKPLKPTPAGRDAYELGRRVLGAVQDLRDGLADSGEIGGELHLGVTPSQSDDMLAAPLDRLRRAYPKLSLRITTAWSPILLEQIPGNRIDAALVHLPETAQPSALLHIEPVSTECMLVVAAKSLNLRSRRSLADVAAYPWVLSQDGCGYRDVLRAAIARLNAPFVAAVETYNGELRMSLTARGLGLSLSTESALRRSKYRDALDVLDLRDFKPRFNIVLAYRTEPGRLAAPLGVLGEALKAAKKPSDATVTSVKNRSESRARARAA
jgi:DNA-binding transcriptional LysR family regulator